MGPLGTNCNTLATAYALPMRLLGNPPTETPVGATFDALSARTRA